MAHDKLTISLPIYKPMKHLKEVCNTYLNIFFLCAKCTDENESILTAIRRSSRREKKSLPHPPNRVRDGGLLLNRAVVPAFIVGRVECTGK